MVTLKRITENKELNDFKFTVTSDSSWLDIDYTIPFSVNEAKTLLENLPSIIQESLIDLYSSTKKHDVIIDSNLELELSKGEDSILFSIPLKVTGELYHFEDSSDDYDPGNTSITGEITIEYGSFPKEPEDNSFEDRELVQIITNTLNKVFDQTCSDERIVID